MIRFVMLVSPIKERMENALKVKQVIPELELVYADAEKCDLFDTHLDSLLTDENVYDGVVMLEDDVILSKDFRSHLNRVLSTHSGDVVQFFERALAQKPLTGGWKNGAEFFSCVCYYMPARFTKVFSNHRNREEFREYFAKKHEPWGYPIDCYIAHVLGRNKMVYWREMPYIVQHSALQSTFKGRSTKRQSKYFIDDLKGGKAIT